VATGLTKGAALGELCNLKAKDALMGFLQVASLLFFYRVLWFKAHNNALTQ
tara:strand:- start:3180 stop:3332 length:153 start_codon:yes stop_codon:yes gene_type:complete